MSETKEQIAEERDQLRGEVERLQGELAESRAAAAGRGAASPARVTFEERPQFRGGTVLTEGERQALESEGVINSAFNGRQLLADDFGIEPKTEAARERLRLARAEVDAGRGRQSIPGVTHVYPSIEPGRLDPAATVRGAVPMSAVNEPGDQAAADRVARDQA